MKIGIVTDSTCDLPQQILKKYPILCIPLHVDIAGKILQDWETITPTTLYPRMLEEEIIPETGAPPLDRFIALYQQALNSYDVIFSVHISSQVSRTHKCAHEAIEALGLRDRVIFINTSAFNATLANIVLELAHHIMRGVVDLEFLLQEALHIRDSSVALYAPHSYQWLVTGKYISGARAMVENMRNTRPILQVRNGELQQVTTVPRHEVMQALVEELEQNFGRLPISLTFTTAGIMPVAQVEFQKVVQASQLRVVKARIQMIGAAIGAHLGPSAIGATAFRYET